MFLETPKECGELAEFLSKYSRTHTIIIVALTEVEYVGRAASHAYPAARVVMIKPDGTLLIHENSRREPLNWQPPGAKQHFSCTAEGLVVKSVRVSPREEVRVLVRDPEFVAACRLDTTTLRVFGTEADIARLVAENPSAIEPGAVVVGREVSTPFGKIDVLLRSPRGELLVVEVKNERAGVSSVVQLKRYVEYYRERGMKVRGVLVAPAISEDGRRLLAREGFGFVCATNLSSRKGPSLENYITR